MHTSKSRLLIQAAFFLTITLLSACATERGALHLPHYLQTNLSPAEFMVCHGYGCHYQTKTYFSDAQWQQVKKPLTTKANNPEQERQHIAEAIAIMEVLVGEAVGTQTDKGGAGFMVSDTGQMDCIDEAVNTSLYLQFLSQEDILKWHSVESPTRRGYFIDAQWPHNSAVIKDNTTDIRYVVDSWFFDNGEQPVIIPVKQWLTGWRPPGH